jgi:hypothetical protein
MPVGLVTHIPDQSVIRGLETVMKGHGQFDHPKAGAEMTGLCGHCPYDEFPEFTSYLWKFFLWE